VNIEKQLLAGENVLYTTRLHWTALGGYALGGGFLGLTGLFMVVAGATDPKSAPMVEIGFVTLLIGLGLIFIGILKRNATVMIVTNKRVLIKVGLMTRKTLEMLFSKIESIGVEEPLFGRLFGYGTVILRGVGGTPEAFTRIAHPLEFRRQVQQQIESSQVTATK
jgi:uncharacterized membrane protein YdbT with pleckstrin-like domain